MKIELHCHSSCSDGSHPPRRVADMARQQDVTLFCLTDHDTVDGYPETVHLQPGVTVLRGLELSVRAFGRTVHFLIYGLKEGPGLSALQRRLDAIREDRCLRILRICQRLETLGVHLDEQAILDVARDRTPGRPDVARALVAAGVVTSFREAFDRFLKDGGPADVTVERIEVSDALHLARAAGGKVSLAHPHSLGGFERVRELFRRHRKHGLEGIEAFYGPYGEAQRRQWLKLASDLDLVVTGGSDFHGDAAPDITRLGVEMDGRRADRLRTWLQL